MGHFCDKPNNSDGNPFQIALHCGRTATQVLTNTKKGQALRFGEETISILDMAPDRNWATAGFDVLIVCVSVFFFSFFFFLTPTKRRLIDGTKVSESERKG